MKSLGDRIKENYENRTRIKLTRRTPVIMRLDGKCFHKLTKKCEKPFDKKFNDIMTQVALDLSQEIQGTKVAYVQSDEISLLITDYDRLETNAWFDYNIQKMCSVAASLASVKFSSLFTSMGLFDCRVFNIPKEEVYNYFIWRQKDWIRNSVHMLARSCYSHKELHKKNQSDIHEMLYKKEINWADIEPRWKNGSFLFKHEAFAINSYIDLKKDKEIFKRYLVSEQEKENLNITCFPFSLRNFINHGEEE